MIKKHKIIVVVIIAKCCSSLQNLALITIVNIEDTFEFKQRIWKYLSLRLRISTVRWKEKLNIIQIITCILDCERVATYRARYEFEICP